MLRTVLKSKIHRARVTDANVEYEGSITIPLDLMRDLDLWEGEKVLVASISKGGRFETYVQPGEPGKRDFIINGGAAHVIGLGETITIMAWARVTEPLKPLRVVLNEKNEVISKNF